MFSNRRDIEIEFGDCDPAGIVYYPNYFRMFDACTAHLFETALAMKKRAITRHYGIVGIPMVETGATFRKPSRYGDVVTVESTLIGFKRTSFTVTHRLYNGGEVAIEAREARVWAGLDPDDPGRIRSLPIPEEIVAAFSR